jgi:hypothetical protein
MARTIDDLGVEASNLYAEAQRQRELEPWSTETSGWVPSQTRVSTTTPAYTSEFDTLFGLGAEKALWASVLAPPGFAAYRKRLFAEQLIPDLGTPTMRESMLERIEGTTGDEEEKKVLANLLKNLDQFDQILIDINSRRTQYQKG